MILLNKENLIKLQAFLASEEIEDKIGFEITGRFDAEEIFKAIKLKNLVEEIANDEESTRHAREICKLLLEEVEKSNV